MTALPDFPLAGTTEYGTPGHTRACCPFWPCRWFLEAHPLAPIWREQSEAIIRQHLNDEHPGWTIEELQAASNMWQ